MFIRARDTVKFIQENKLSSFLYNNRKGNIIKKFKIHNNEVSFFEDELICKMIPKNEINIFETKDIKMIITEDDSTLVFQEFKESPCQFLSYDEDTDEIQQITFDEIIPEDTRILCYDIELEDYYFSKVQVTIIFSFQLQSEDDEVDEHFKEQNDMFKKELKTLSDYILFTEQHTGLILNNILVV